MSFAGALSDGYGGSDAADSGARGSKRKRGSFVRQAGRASQAGQASQASHASHSVGRTGTSKVFDQAVRAGSLACEYDNCGQRFDGAAALREHVANHCSERNFVCDVCGKRFARARGLQVHQRTHTGEKPYTCSFEGCDRAFAHLSNLQYHVATVHDEAGKKYVCTYEGCGRTFVRNHQYVTHLRSHTGEKPFKCPADDSICTATFATSSYAKNHYCRVHCGRDVPAGTCGKKKCDKATLAVAVATAANLTAQVDSAAAKAGTSSLMKRVASAASSAAAARAVAAAVAAAETATPSRQRGAPALLLAAAATSRHGTSPSAHSGRSHGSLGDGNGGSGSSSSSHADFFPNGYGGDGRGSRSSTPMGQRQPSPLISSSSSSSRSSSSSSSSSSSWIFSSSSAAYTAANAARDVGSSLGADALLTDASKAVTNLRGAIVAACDQLSLVIQRGNNWQDPSFDLRQAWVNQQHALQRVIQHLTTSQQETADIAFAAVSGQIF